MRLVRPRPAISVWAGPAPDWRVLRKARLRALRTSPQAFCGSFFWEFLLLPRAWRARLLQATWMVAWSGDVIVGLAALKVEPVSEAGAAETGTGDCYVESVWVEPRVRRLGVGRELLHTVEERAREEGFGVLLLWVLEPNEIARRMYLALGFRSTGERQPLKVRRGWVPECRMIKLL